VAGCQKFIMATTANHTFEHLLEKFTINISHVLVNPLNSLSISHMCLSTLIMVNLVNVNLSEV